MKFLDAPEHIAIVMDGNRRWARKRLLPSYVGHKRGVRRVDDIVLSAIEFGVKHLTLFAFSTENWNRSKKEIDKLMVLLEE